MNERPSVGIIGGGLAGLAAASILCERGFEVEIFEARRYLGGRAGSFIDPTTGELVDHCQHVAMGCCTAFLDFIRRTGVQDSFRRDEVLHFFSPDGKRSELRGSWWLPAPLHLGPSLLRLGYLSWREKLSIARAIRQLARIDTSDVLLQRMTIGQWLRRRRQSQQVIDRFWSIVLESALGESVDCASIAAARKVFVDGFLAHRDAYHVYVPQQPLGEIYDDGIARWLQERRVTIHLESRVNHLPLTGDRVQSLTIDGCPRQFDDYLLAIAWPMLPRLCDAAALRTLGIAPDAITGSPITSIHLWFDRAITRLPHAVLVDRLTQWVFRHGEDGYCQAVISASHALETRSRKSILAEVLADLRATFPEAALANLVQHRIITQPQAVFSYRPQLDEVRPAQKTQCENLYLAGDWTDTGWPSTMESAVRSGYLAAEAVIRKFGHRDETIIPPELRHAPLTRWLTANR